MRHNGAISEQRSHGRLGSALRWLSAGVAHQKAARHDAALAPAYASNISHRLPLMYAVVLVDIVALAIAFRGTAPDFLTLLIPLPIMAAIIWRAWYWLPSNVQCRPPHILFSDVRRLPLLGTFVSAASVCWALALYRYGSDTQQSLVHYLTAVTCFTGILGLAHSPQTAIRMAVVVMIPSSVFFLSDDHPNGPVVVAVQIVVTLLLVLITSSYHQDFVSLEESRQELALQRQRMEDLANANHLIANRDVLTGANNRRRILELLGEAIAERVPARPWLALIDLNGFKHINDIYGHSAGDAILCATARRIEAIPAVQAFGRIGGDEFALLISPELDAAQVNDLSDSICADISQAISLRDLSIAATASIGLYRCDSTQVSECLERADAALYKSKADSSHRRSIFTVCDERALQAHRQITRIFTSADLGSQLRLVYQPIIDCTTGAAVCFEALVRWSPDGKRLLPPAEFIDLAEATGRICELTDQVLTTALDECRVWQRDCSLAVNLSAHDLLRNDTAARIQNIVRESGAPPDKIILEVTETALISDYAIASRNLKKFRDMGMRIALDDFGTGQSSLSHVHNLPIDSLKIDKGFAADMVSSARARAVVSTILGLSRQLGLDCTIEGIETVQQQSVAQALGVRRMQGYLFGKPQPYSAMASQLAVFASQEGIMHPAPDHGVRVA